MTIRSSSFVDLCLKRERSLLKTENIIYDFLKDWDVHDGHRSSADNFKFTDHLFTQKFLCSLKFNDFEKKLHEKLHAMLAQNNRISFVFFDSKTFISLSLMSPLTPEASTADTI